jgi:8-oxo-dGTP pyrophosphatase MutT (NUDIX family)
MNAWCFAVAVVRMGHRFLLVHEKDGTWYFPAGRLELGETFSKAAVRECMEESGVPIQLTGIYRVEHSPSREGARFRVLFAGHPVDDTQPRLVPNPDTNGARWVTRDEAMKLPLRGVEVPDVMRAVLGGAPQYPTRLLLPELSRWD